MSSVLYRQGKKSIYNNIRTHRNTALNHSIQTIFKIYHNTSLIHNYSDKGNNRLSDSSSTNSNTLPTIENKKIIYRNPSEKRCYVKKKSPSKNLQLIKNKSIVLPKIRMKGPLVNVTENINQSMVEWVKIQKQKEVDYTDLNKGEVFMNESLNEENIKNYIQLIEKQIDVQFAINNMMETD